MLHNIRVNSQAERTKIARDMAHSCCQIHRDFKGIGNLFCLKNGQNRSFNLWKYAVNGWVWKVLSGFWMFLSTFMKVQVPFEQFCVTFWPVLSHFWPCLGVYMGHFGGPKNGTKIGSSLGDFGPFLGRSGVISVSFGIILGSSWCHFDLFLGSLLGLFRPIFGSFWPPFFPIIGPFLCQFCRFLGSWLQH